MVFRCSGYEAALSPPCRQHQWPHHPCTIVIQHALAFALLAVCIDKARKAQLQCIYGSSIAYLDATDADLPATTVAMTFDPMAKYFDDQHADRQGNATEQQNKCRYYRIQPHDQIGRGNLANAFRFRFLPDVSLPLH
uniref:Uncharacterized protein n=1 Tax=Anopheles farauti TaxID=69004 RepID=A0A182QCF7_9DIPT